MKMSNQHRGLNEEELGFLTDHKVSAGSTPNFLDAYVCRLTQFQSTDAYFARMRRTSLSETRGSARWKRRPSSTSSDRAFCPLLTYLCDHVHSNLDNSSRPDDVTDHFPHPLAILPAELAVAPPPLPVHATSPTPASPLRPPPPLPSLPQQPRRPLCHRQSPKPRARRSVCQE